MRERFEAFFPQRAETLGKVGVTLAGLACQVHSSSVIVVKSKLSAGGLAF